MRAREFVSEDKAVHTGLKPHKSAEYALPGAHRVAGTSDRIYDLNRVMQFVACSDGKTPIDVPEQSWIGRNNGAFPYTPQEAEMLKHAYRAMGAKWDDAINPNPKNKSQEAPAQQKSANSPIKPFGGYPR